MACSWHPRTTWFRPERDPDHVPVPRHLHLIIPGPLSPDLVYICLTWTHEGITERRNSTKHIEHWLSLLLRYFTSCSIQSSPLPTFVSLKYYPCIGCRTHTISNLFPFLLVPLPLPSPVPSWSYYGCGEGGTLTRAFSVDSTGFSSFCSFCPGLRLVFLPWSADTDLQ